MSQAHTNVLNKHLYFNDPRGSPIDSALWYLTRKLTSKNNMKILRRQLMAYCDTMNMDDPFISNTEFEKILYESIVLARGRLACQQKSTATTVLYGDMPVHVNTGGATHHMQAAPPFRETNRLVLENLKRYMINKQIKKKYNDIVYIKNNPDIFIVPRPSYIQSKKIQRTSVTNKATDIFTGC